MAFENLFGGIDFQAGNKMKSQQNAQLNAMLGQAIAAEQQEQDRELKRRQLEMKANEFKLGKTAENAAMKLEMGMELTPQERAALNVKVKTSGPSVYTDQFGNQVVRPSGWSQYGAPQAPPEMMGTPFNPDPAHDPRLNRQIDAMAGQPAPMPAPETRLTVDMLQGMGGQVPPIDASQLSTVPYQGQRDVVSDEGMLDQVVQSAAMPNVMQELGQRAGGRYMQSPVGAVDAGKAFTALQEYAGKNNLDLNKFSEQEKIKLENQLRKQKIETDFAKESKKPQEVLAIESAFQEAENMNATIKDIYESADYLTTGFIGQQTAGIGGTPAHNLAANLKQIEADAGLSKLIEVKERGGTFGALQEKELELLVNSRAALIQSQDPKQFKSNLIKYQNQRNKTMRLMADFFKKKYGEIPNGLLSGLEENIINPDVSAAKAGKIFINEKGEKIRFQDGKWKIAK